MPSLRTVLTIALLGVICLARTAAAASLSITVSDATGKPVTDAVVLLEAASGPVAVKPLADVDISQAKRQFQPTLTLITVGTRVNFPNFDTVRHHVYSFSPIKTFELKLYAGVPGKPVTFDKPGVAVLGCNIHDSMAAWVFVADTPWYARSQDGRAKIDAVPAGNYRVRLWHPSLPPNVEPATPPLTLAAGDVELALRLPQGVQP